MFSSLSVADEYIVVVTTRKKKKNTKKMNEMYWNLSINKLDISYSN